MVAEFVAGIDEAGRGPLAGPVTAACVVLPAGYFNPAVTDSKALSGKKRAELFREISTVAVAYAVVSVGPRRIDRLNIYQATRLAMRLSAERVYQALLERFTRAKLRLLIDGNARIDTSFPQQTIIKGDLTVAVISAASILAKVTRDRLMTALDGKYPGYGFAVHKGYPTAQHRLRLTILGPTPIHRRHFAGVAELFEEGKHRAARRAAGVSLPEEEGL